MPLRIGKNQRKRKQSSVSKKILVKEKEGNEDIVENPHDISDTSDYLSILTPSVTNDFSELQRKPVKGDFILVKFYDDKSNRPRIQSINTGKNLTKKSEDNNSGISFYCMPVKLVNKFYLPDIPDIANVTTSDIVLVLPPPRFNGTV